MKSQPIMSCITDFNITKNISCTAQLILVISLSLGNFLWLMRFHRFSGYFEPISRKLTTTDANLSDIFYVYFLFRAGTEKWKIAVNAVVQFLDIQNWIQQFSFLCQIIFTHCKFLCSRYHQRFQYSKYFSLIRSKFNFHNKEKKCCLYVTSRPTLSKLRSRLRHDINHHQLRLPRTWCRSMWAAKDMLWWHSTVRQLTVST